MRVNEIGYAIFFKKILTYQNTKSKNEWNEAKVELEVHNMMKKSMQLLYDKFIVVF